MRSCGFMVKPTAAARWRMFSRATANSSFERPYFLARCSSRSSPSGAMSGLSSKGWKWMSAAISPSRRFSAVSRLARPTAHQGHTTSETKSICSFLAIWGLPWAPRVAAAYMAKGGGLRQGFSYAAHGGEGCAFLGRVGEIRPGRELHHDHPVFEGDPDQLAEHADAHQVAGLRIVQPELVLVGALGEDLPILRPVAAAVARRLDPGGRHNAGAVLQDHLAEAAVVAEGGVE